MKIDDWLQWPTRSTDPAANAAIAVLLALVIIFALLVGATMLIPIALAFAVVRGVQWYVNRPVPTDQLYAQTEQRSISANFPDADKFMDAYLDRFIDAIRDDLPAYKVFQTMAVIAEELYKEERLTNPLPPLPPANTIEEGRYRDQLIANQRKSVDAPRTLEVFHKTLGKAYLDLIARLPSIAKSTPKEFSKCGEVEIVRDVPARRRAAGGWQVSAIRDAAVLRRRRRADRPLCEPAQAARPQLPRGLRRGFRGAGLQAHHAG